MSKSSARTEVPLAEGGERKTLGTSSLGTGRQAGALRVWGQDAASSRQLF